jgi:predicted branched-subunit amino acid permease
VLLGARNAFYGLRLAPALRARGAKKFVAAQIVIDESTAMAVAQDRADRARLAFWSTGLSVYVLWNLATVVGALAGESLSDPEVLGLDAAIPAAFLALIAPQIRSREGWFVAAVAVTVALMTTPVVPAGVPVLLAALVALVAGWRRPR